ncbi:ABC transporter ATP-binding protein [Micromonospora sp. CNB394]|uniref:ABC transporter ATP-binding protein n=1 Tax=Micromonospora sp. CNB394 TaxID=1169151 RepID=UPI00037022F1|nr:ABC transporter ATP-binding protein [Micromonospora sp. CNB394]
MADIRMLSEEPDQRRVLRRVWPYLRPHRRLLVLAVCVNLLSTIALSLVPAVVGRAVDALTEADADRLLHLCALLFVLVTARMVLLRQAELLLVRLGERVVRDLRDRAVERIAAAPLRFLESHRGGDLLQRVTVEVAELATFVRQQIPDLISLTGYVVFTGVVLFVSSWQLALLLVVLFAPMMWFVGRRFRRAAGAAYAGEAAAEAAVTASVRETLDAREQVQAADAAGPWRARLGERLDDRLATVRRTQKALTWLETAWIVQGVVTAGLLAAGGALVAAQAVTVGVVVTFVLASRELFSSADDLTYVAGELVGSQVNLARLLDLLDATEPPRPVPAQPPGGNGSADLVVEGVCFSYGTDRVLHEVNLVFPAGSRVALVGETGSGKTTLAKVMCGLYAPDAGVVRLGGADLAALDEGERRRRLVLVPQQVHLITGTLAENLALAPGGADPGRAIHELGLDDWVASLPDGLHTHLGPRGAHLSAGERQLVGLIRAALLTPDVVVLDEATADLDPATAHRIETAVAQLHTDRTLVVIAHRQATIERFPRVVRLAGGVLVGA